MGSWSQFTHGVVQSLSPSFSLGCLAWVCLDFDLCLVIGYSYRRGVSSLSVTTGKERGVGRFFDKLEKLDVLTIIFVVIVCLFALVVMYGWPKGEWAFGWTALAAIGGLSAGVGAFYAARVALKVAQEERVISKEEKRRQAAIYRWVFGFELNSVLVSLEQIESLLRDYKSCMSGQTLTPEMVGYIDTLKGGLTAPITLENLSEIYVFGENKGQAIAAIVANLPALNETLSVLTLDPKITNKKLKMVTFTLERIAMMKGHYAKIDWAD